MRSRRSALLAILLCTSAATPAPRRCCLRAAEHGHLHSIADPLERSNPMRHLKLFRWTAALMVAIALAPAAASAQEDGTVTISGLFSMDYLYGEIDLYLGAPDLL